MSLGTQVENLTGLTANSTMDDWLTNGAKEIINLMSPEKLWNVATESTIDNGNGFSSDTCKILDVYREDDVYGGFSCREIPSSLRGKATTGSGYIEEATLTAPMFYRLNGKIYILPEPDGNSEGIISTVNYPTIAYNSAGITSFPTEYEYLVVLYSSLRAILYLLADKRTDLPGDLVISALAPIAPSLSASSVSFDTPAPTYTAPIISLGSISIPDLVISSVAPAVPTLSDNSISFDEDAPTYTSPIVSLGSLAISDLTISSVAPAVPTLSDNSISFDEDAPTYTSPIVSLGSIAISDLTISSVVPIAPTLSDNSISFNEDAPTYIMPTVSPDWDDVDTWINDEEDNEMASSRVSAINAQLSQYSNDIQNAVNVFNKENAIYQAELKKATDDASLSSQDDGQKIQKYSAEVQAYQSDVAKQVQEFQNNFQKEIQIWQTERTTDIQKYSADIQNALNTFNKENIEYQAGLQVAIRDADLSQADDVQKVQKYSAELQKYQANIGQEVQEYQQNFEKDFKIWQAEDTMKLQQYSTDIQNAVNVFNKENAIYQAELKKATDDASLSSQDDGQKIQKYSAEVQAYQSDVAKQVQEFQNNFQKEIQIWQTERTTDIQQYSTDVQNALNTFNKENVEYQAQLQISVQNTQLENQNKTLEVQKYASELQEFQAEIAKEVQEHDAALKNLNSDMQWLQGQYAQLSSEYTKGIQILTGGGANPQKDKGEK